ncbi:hypothetical protein JCM10207_007537 [Rhodosporidiobolus poonsookiae]
MSPHASTSRTPDKQTDHLSQRRPRRAATLKKRSLADSPHPSDDSPYEDGPSSPIRPGSFAPNRKGGGHRATRREVDQVGWDRELDTDSDEPLAREEHFLLRLPPALASRLRPLVDKRALPSEAAGLSIEFKDARRAVFRFGGEEHSAKLVDLPTLLESQRLTGGRKTVKVADVCQMLVVDEDEGKADAEEKGKGKEKAQEKRFEADEYVWEHGITPPLKHVRKRRFRRAVDLKTAERVEDAVTKLLAADAKATEVKYGAFPFPLPSSYFSLQLPSPIELFDHALASSDDPFSASDADSSSGFDADLAADIEDDLARASLAHSTAAAASAAEPAHSSAHDLFGSSSDEDDDEAGEEADDESMPLVSPPGAESVEKAALRRKVDLLARERAVLDGHIEAERVKLVGEHNPLMKQRIESTRNRLLDNRSVKVAQHAELSRQLDSVGDTVGSAARVPALHEPHRLEPVLEIESESE